LEEENGEHLDCAEWNINCGEDSEEDTKYRPCMALLRYYISVMTRKKYGH
jgi:hypothetical protein